jgi:hypothetical protein
MDPGPYPATGQLISHYVCIYSCDPQSSPWHFLSTLNSTDRRTFLSLNWWTTCLGCQHACVTFALYPQASLSQHTVATLLSGVIIVIYTASRSARPRGQPSPPIPIIIHFQHQLYNLRHTTCASMHNRCSPLYWPRCDFHLCLQSSPSN